MYIDKIKNFAYSIKSRDLQSFENDLLQFWDLLEKDKQIKKLCTRLETDYSDLSTRIKTFYERINESFNKKNYIEETKSILSENDNSITALGYFLYREELKLKLPGYHRVMIYWFPELNQETPFDSKKTFTNQIIISIVDYLQKNITTNIFS